MSETQTSLNTVRQLKLTSDPAVSEWFASVKNIFPNVKISDYIAVSSPAYHDILKEQVVSCILPQAVTTFLLGETYSISSRKFCLDSKTSFLRGYKVVTDTTKPIWATNSTKILAIGENFHEFGREAPLGIYDFVDYYFSGDPDEIENAFNLPKLRGKYETFYAVTVQDNKVLRCKQYTYDEQSSFSDWDVMYIVLQRKLKF